MKTTRVISTLTIAIFLSAKIWAQEAGKDQMVVPLSEPNKPYKLDVHLVDGSITITGYEGKSVIVEVTGEKRKGPEHEGGGMRRINSGSNADIQAEENNNEINVHGNAGRAVNLILKVPQNEGTFKIGTVNDGDVVGSNLNGELEVSNVNGAIKLKNIAGSVVANTVNGNVIVTFRSIDPKAAMAYSTLNGNVDVTFPASLRASVKGFFFDLRQHIGKAKPDLSKRLFPFVSKLAWRFYECFLGTAEHVGDVIGNAAQLVAQFINSLEVF